MAFRFNPLSGQLEIDRSLDIAEKIASEFDCDAGTVVGDIVRASTTTQNKVISLASNVYPNLAFGVVIDKPSATVCQVLISGKITGVANGISGLSFGKVAYIDTSGNITTTVPGAGEHLQKMGIAIKSDELFLLPSWEKVIL